MSHYDDVWERLDAKQAAEDAAKIEAGKAEGRVWTDELNRVQQNILTFAGYDCKSYWLKRANGSYASVSDVEKALELDGETVKRFVHQVSPGEEPVEPKRRMYQPGTEDDLDLLIQRMSAEDASEILLNTPDEDLVVEYICGFLVDKYGWKTAQANYGIMMDGGFYYIDRPTTRLTMDSPVMRVEPVTFGDIKPKIEAGADSPSKLTDEKIQQLLADLSPSKRVADASGAVKDDGGKVQVDMVDPAFILGMGEVLTDALKVHDPYNWAKGFKWSRLIASSTRHLLAITRGEDIDPDTGLAHALHLGCNAMFLYYHLRFHKNLDDRFYAGK